MFIALDSGASGPGSGLWRVDEVKINNTKLNGVSL